MSEPEVVRRAPYGENPEVGPRARRTYDRILQAALRVFERQGLQHTTMNDIARATPSARATVYQYFESKQDILRALLDRIGGEMLGLVAAFEPLDATTESRDRLRAWIDDAAAVTIKYSSVVDAWTDPSVVSEDLNEQGDRFLGRFGRELGSKFGGDPILDQAVAAVALYATIEALTGLFLHDDLSVSLSQAFDELALITHVTLFPDAEVPAWSPQSSA